MAIRGRKKGANGEQTKKILLEVAAQEFATCGYHETKVSTIVKKANVSQPAFYLYFESKEHIYQELVHQFQLRLSVLTSESKIEPGVEMPSLAEKISYGMGRILRFFSENPDLTRIGFYSSQEAILIKQKMTEQICGNLRAEAESGYFKPQMNIAIAAECVIGAIERLTLTELLTGKRNAEDLASEIVNILLYGLINDK
ncbi:TetR/AcrR family transcriptional regulator [Cytobacillus gottheilii]|uniref:TetR/AcrR family transcriptional regulator n=1 Tax=Cytobacillus gottheilii TaxID=859144 RepID=UPI0009BC1371|nr:TetR/AcrR family transcriptional regulator [Cytobacillus gottheilii]